MHFFLFFTAEKIGCVSHSSEYGECVKNTGALVKGAYHSTTVLNRWLILRQSSAQTLPPMSSGRVEVPIEYHSSEIGVFY